MNKKIIALAAGLLILLLASCSMDSSQEEHMDHQMSEEMEHEYVSGEMSQQRIANEEGVKIQIISPEPGVNFAQGEDIVIQVVIENFILDDAGSHWHVYVNGESHGMIMGQTQKHVLRGLEPGEYMISTYLANGSHQEFEDGSMIHLNVIE